MPSGDRFDVLAGPSSSIEQESQVPATGTNTGDQVMQESAEPSSSAEAGNMSVAGLEGSLSHVLTKEEKKQLFLKKKREIDEKKKKEEDEEE